jgi:hypothetical protein
LRSPPIEFRVVTKPRVDADLLIEGNWDMRWQSAEESVAQTLLKAKRLLDDDDNDDDTMYKVATTSLFIIVCVILYVLFDYWITISIIATLLVAKFWHSNRIIDNRNISLFVYGTLQAGYHWNQKYLSTAKYVSKMTTIERELESFF